MKLKALRELLVNKFYSKYIPSSLLDNSEVERIIKNELEQILADNRLDEKNLVEVDKRIS
jgi:hypothetical protein